jgi:hypothetical protein
MAEEQGLIGIENPELQIFRIFPLRYFEESLRLKLLVLVPPQNWEDPFERLPEHSVITDTRTSPWSQIPLADFLKPAYGQCWSMNQDSDTLWRAYSRVLKDPHANRNTCPSEEGVQVRTTARKLLSALVHWSPSDHRHSCFLGRVRYMPDSDIQQYIANQVGLAGEQAFESGAARAQLLFLKRPPFRHEEEIRLVYVEQRNVPRQDLIRVPIDPSALFDEVTFDPRLATFERVERERTTRALGYQGPFGDSGLYQGRLLEIVVGTRVGNPPNNGVQPTPYSA